MSCQVFRVYWQDALELSIFGITDDQNFPHSIYIYMYTFIILNKFFGKWSAREQKSIRTMDYIFLREMKWKKNVFLWQIQIARSVCC